MNFITASGFGPFFAIITVVVGLGLWKVIKDFLPW